MLYRLSVDVGTASVGYAIWLLDEDLKPVRLFYGGSRIFSEPTIAKTGELKKAKKRLNRNARRQLQRKARRYRRLTYLFPLVGLSSEQVAEAARKARLDGHGILEMRARAAEEPIGLPELMRVLMHLGKRRGYSGTFRVQPKDGKSKSEKGKVQSGVIQTHSVLQGRTIGQYLFELHRQGKPTKNIYALRSDYLDEFERIWKTQSRHHPVLNRRDASGAPVKERFRQAIFYQRPLRAFSDKVGECPLIPGEKRAPKAHPAFQRFRIQETLNNLGWGRRSRPLSEEQKRVIKDMLLSRGEVSFDSIYKELDKKGLLPEAGECLNMDTPSRDALRGNSTLAGFRALKLDKQWEGLDDSVQNEVICFLADMTTPELPDIPGWEEGLSDEARAFIDDMVATGKFDRLSKMRHFESGRASYSVEAMTKLLPLLEEGMRTDQAVAEGIKRGWFASEDFEPLGYLPPFEETGNALVDVAMRQVKAVVDEIVSCLGCNPAQVIVEMGREMGLGWMKKRELENRLNQNRLRNRDLAEAVIGEGCSPSRENRIRLQLWKEQGGDPNLSEGKIAHCIYSGRPINISAALDGSKTQLDHIRPRKRFFDTNRPQYLVLCLSEANKFKGDRTPWEAFHDSPEAGGIRYEWDDIVRRIKQLPREAGFKKKLLLSKETEPQDIEDFLDRQMHATQWVARLAAQWMKHICPDVWVTKGWLTAQLRRQWGLETVIDEVRRLEGLPPCKNKHGEWNKRLDHRHHFIDACVIGLTSRGLFQQAAKAFREQAEVKDDWDDIEFVADPPIPPQALRKQVLDVCKRMVVSHKPDRFLSAKWFDDNPFGLFVEHRDNDGAEERWVVHREPLIDLVSRAGKEGRTALPVDQARKNLERVVGESLRAMLLETLDECVKSNRSIPDEFSNIRRYPRSEKSPVIRKVRVRVAEFNPDSHKIVKHRQRLANGERYKVLASAENAYVEVREHEEAPADVRVVSMFQALEGPKTPENGVRRFYKGDMVTYRDRPGTVYVIRKICKADGSHPIRIYLVPHSEARTVGGGSKEGMPPMKAADGLVEVRPSTAHMLRHFHTTPAALRPVIGRLMRE